MTAERFIISGTICWDCTNATGGCSWSDSFIPVEGWTATATKKDTLYESYIVIDCPLFDRDAYRSGMIRYKKEEKDAEKQ